jgi:hypothetical protein
MQTCVVTYLQQGMAVVGNGSIDVGNEKLIRKSGQPAVEILGESSSKPRIENENPLTQNLLKTERPGISSAMAQQCGDIGRGNQSAPQKFVRLVGCRDPKARPAQR